MVVQPDTYDRTTRNLRQYNQTHMTRQPDIYASTPRPI